MRPRARATEQTGTSVPRRWARKGACLAWKPFAEGIREACRGSTGSTKALGSMARSWCSRALIPLLPWEADPARGLRREGALRNAKGPKRCKSRIFIGSIAAIAAVLLLLLLFFPFNNGPWGLFLGSSPAASRTLHSPSPWTAAGCPMKIVNFVLDMDEIAEVRFPRPPRAGAVELGQRGGAEEAGTGGGAREGAGQEVDWRPAWMPERLSGRRSPDSPRPRLAGLTTIARLPLRSLVFFPFPSRQEQRTVNAELQANASSRKPRTAIINMVSFHVEIVASLAYHFSKLKHNVTVYTRDDQLGMQQVMYPFHWKGMRRFERFFQSYGEFDTVVLATYPTCHEPLLRKLASLKLEQRYLVVVHNPDQVESGRALDTLATAPVRVLAIAPHVATAVARATRRARPAVAWFAPIFPALMPEDCTRGSWRMRMPACDRRKTWTDLSRGTLPNQPLGKPARRTGFCIQGKLDPMRRGYDVIFDEMRRRKEELLAANISLSVIGRITRQDRGQVSLPSDLLDAGLLRMHESLPFQEYYEVLHGCQAVLPAFASDAYFFNKGSSTVGTALVAGTPIVATKRLLRAYSYLDTRSVYVVGEKSSPVDSMLRVSRMRPKEREATEAALRRLRIRLLRRNLVALCKLMGSDYSCPPRDRLKAAKWSVAETSAFRGLPAGRA